MEDFAGILIIGAGKVVIEPLLGFFRVFPGEGSQGVADVVSLGFDGVVVELVVEREEFGGFVAGQLLPGSLFDIFCGGFVHSKGFEVGVDPGGGVFLNEVVAFLGEVVEPIGRELVDVIEKGRCVFAREVVVLKD